MLSVNSIKFTNAEPITKTTNVDSTYNVAMISTTDNTIYSVPKDKTTLVTMSGNQSIGGVKTFSSPPILTNLISSSSGEFLIRDSTTNEIKIGPTSFYQINDAVNSYLANFGVAPTSGSMKIGYTTSTLSNANDNILIGKNVGNAISTSSSNLFIGTSSGGGSTALSGSRHIGLGHLSSQNIQGSAYDTVCIGTEAGKGFTTNSRVIAIGHYAGPTSTTFAGTNSIFMGYGSGLSATSQNNSIFIGDNAGKFASSGNNNTAIGYGAFASLSKSVNTGTHNTVLGYNAHVNIAGSTSGNTVLGSNAGGNHSSGSQNVLIGAEVATQSIPDIENVNYNTTIANTVMVGYRAGAESNNGSGSSTLTNCVFIGSYAGSNTTASENTFVGRSSGIGNATKLTGTYNTGTGSYSCAALQGAAQYNTSIGGRSIQQCTTGSDNVAVGFGAGTAYNSSFTGVSVSGATGVITGTRNTFLGTGASTSKSDITNAVAIGNNAKVDSNNFIVIGNTSNTTINNGNGTAITSDIRDKSDIRDTTLGTNFIMSLRPVDFKWNFRSDYNGEPNDGSKKRTRYHHGLIAQEVGALAPEFGGFIDLTHDGGTEELCVINYNELFAPMIKAMQEMQARINDLEARIENM